jgi:hypothetical protein
MEIFLTNPTKLINEDTAKGNMDIANTDSNLGMIG